MGSSCLSIVSLSSRFLHRTITAAGLSSQTVEIDGDTTIHFWSPPVATSKPQLVFIHGFGPQSIWQWRQQISFCVGEFDVYVPDLVFFGDSFTKTADRSEVSQATCIAKLLGKLGIRLYSLVGTSYGGFVAYRLAAMWPERVQKVVIAVSTVNMRLADNDELLKKANVEKIEDLLMSLTASHLRKLLGSAVFRRPYIPDFVLNDCIGKLYSENRKDKLELLQGLTMNGDDISPLSQHDQIFLLEKAFELKRLVGEKARLEVIRNAAHVPQLENAGQFNDIIKNFLHGFS
ncbi:putative hydrolase/acyltransferase (alpha/beta hydrolase superfamily) [Handroanthus impetiginosus]|uniref:Putative hydrolase/acyltransferase (Alpha/beta hydrolase superfamily) n=1 Tax=Handroanthus impetiginosus TaxID=429701 RepID=A0A2G9HVQ1_9LAMI|nr:putative hydrolase/acyltransferase (alpha/beta hydrolase superfamily) [Handroanthus impetiginosus]